MGSEEQIEGGRRASRASFVGRNELSDGGLSWRLSEREARVAGLNERRRGMSWFTFTLIKSRKSAQQISVGFWNFVEQCRRSYFAAAAADAFDGSSAGVASATKKALKLASENSFCTRGLIESNACLTLFGLL